jgi:hypothetical protein
MQGQKMNLNLNDVKSILKTRKKNLSHFDAGDGISSLMCAFAYRCQNGGRNSQSDGQRSGSFDIFAVLIANAFKKKLNFVKIRKLLGKLTFNSLKRNLPKMTKTRVKVEKNSTPNPWVGDSLG